MSRVPEPLVSRVMGHFETPRRRRTPLVRCLPVRFCLVPKLSQYWDCLGLVATGFPEPSSNAGLRNFDSLCDISQATPAAAHCCGLTNFVALVGHRGPSAFVAPR